MSDSRRVDGDRAFCYQCDHHFNRSEGGLTCPNCGSEFVEFRSGTESPTFDSPPPLPHPNTRPQSPNSPQNPFHDHNPWADIPDPPEGNITTFEFNGGRGRSGVISFTSRSFQTGNIGRNGNATFLGPGFTSFNLGPSSQNGIGGFQTGGTAWTREVPAQHPAAAMQDLFSMIFQTMQTVGPGMQQGFGQGVHRNGEEAAFNPFNLFNQLLMPPNARPGDVATSQEAFDRILQQLMEQNNGSTAPGPASDDAIASLPMKQVDKEMMGSDGKAECSICMENVDLGETVTSLPCKHWFHRECVVAWLKEHDTCPHCRSPITPGDPNQSRRPQGSRRSSRRSSSVSSPRVAASGQGMPPPIPERPSELRNARQDYYGRRTNPDLERPRNHRHSSSHHDGRYDQNESNGEATSSSTGGITDWFRNRMHF